VKYSNANIFAVTFTDCSGLLFYTRPLFI